MLIQKKKKKKKIENAKKRLWPYKGTEQSRAEVLFDHRQCDKLIKMPTDWES